LFCHSELSIYQANTKSHVSLVTNGAQFDTRRGLPNPTTGRGPLLSPEQGRQPRGPPLPPSGRCLWEAGSRLRSGDSGSEDFPDRVIKRFLQLRP